jgi:hypothetical protein
MLEHPWLANTSHPSATIQSLLAAEYEADCIAVSPDLVYSMLHEVIRRNNLRSAHASEDESIIRCHDVDKDMKLTIRVTLLPKEAPRSPSELMGHQRTRSQDLSTAAAAAATTTTESITPQRPTKQPAETPDPVEGQKTPAAAMQEEGQLLRLEFRVTSGNGADFR